MKGLWHDDICNWRVITYKKQLKYWNMLKGIFPVLPTCFTPDGALFLEAQKKVIQFAINSGAHGLVFPGVASEYNYLTAAERGELIRLLVAEVNDRLPIIAGISDKKPEDVIGLGQEALRNGIRHFMLMAPHHLGKDIDKHHHFFKSVTAELPGCEIILQNAPTPIGAGLETNLLVELVRQNPAITYVKEETLPSGPTISALLTYKIPHLHGVFGGGGARYIIDELNRGAIGAVPAVEITDLHATLFNAHQNGQDQMARKYYQLSLPLLTAQKIYRMKLTKYALFKRGVCDAQVVRAPSLELDEHAIKDIDHMLSDLDEAKVFTWKH